MTVATTQISEVWTGDASSVTFPIPFPFLDRAHLIVWKEDSLGVETSMTIVSATGEGESSGGSITLTEPVGVGYTLHVRRNTPKTQETDYVPHDPFPADSHERALDKLTMIVQELIASGSIDIDIDHLGDLIGGSSTIIWTVSPDGTKLIGSVVPGAEETYKVKVNADDATPGFLDEKLSDTTDTQFSPTEDGSQMDNIVYQLTGLGTRLNRVKDAGFDFEVGPFPQASHAGGRGICFGRRFVAGVEVDTWVAQANNGKLYWTSNNDASRWKVVTEDLSVHTAFPNDRTHYGWSCIQFVYVAGTHNCYCWVMGSGDHERHITFIEHKAENYNADGTFKASALDGVTYPVGTGPYTPIDIMQVDTSGGIFFAGDDPKVGYTTDLANFQLAVTADTNVGGLGFDGETTVQAIERDTGVIWRSSTLGSPGSFAKVATFYLDDVPVANFPMSQPGGSAAQWGSMFSMYGQWLSINFRYVAGGIGFIYSDDGIYWYSSRDEATAFYDANNDGLRWFATNAAPNSESPVFQLIVSVIPAHRRMSFEKGAVISGPTILREIPNATILGTDHRGRVVDGTEALSSYAQPLDADLTAIAALSTQAFGRSLLTQADAPTAMETLGALAASEKGAANGVAPLGADSKIASTYLPAYVDDVLEFANLAAFPATGESGKIYVALDTNKTYRWSGSAYAVVSETLALGETSSTAYRGDRGATAYTHSQATGNPHGTTFAQIASIPAALDAIDGLTPAADRIPYYTGANSAALAPLSAFGRSLIDDADAATARATIGAFGGVGVANYSIPYTLNGDLVASPMSYAYDSLNAGLMVVSNTAIKAVDGNRSDPFQASIANAGTNTARGYLATNSSAPSGSRNWSMGVDGGGSLRFTKWADELGSGSGIARITNTGAVQAPYFGDSNTGNQLVGPRKTGWAAPTGTATRTTFATSTVTLPQLAERLKALIDDLISHGLIGA